MSDRINKIVSFVDENKIVCDIGCDHGITSMKVYDEKSPIKVIATDISQNSLKKIVDKISGSYYDIETVVTDGIYELDKYQPEEIIISGMGGFLITKIIDQGKNVATKAEKLILQANNSTAVLRRYLLENGFEIIDEAIAYDDDIYYDIIVASFRADRTFSYENDCEYEFGKLNIDNKNPLLKRKLEKILFISENIKSRIQGNHTESSKKRIDEINKEQMEIGEILKCL